MDILEICMTFNFLWEAQTAKHACNYKITQATNYQY